MGGLRSALLFLALCQAFASPPGACAATDQALLQGQSRLHRTANPAETSTQDPEEVPLHPPCPPGQPEEQAVVPMVRPLRVQEAELNATQKARRAQAALDCQLTAWSEWSSCENDPQDSLKARTRHRNREIINPQQVGGRPCPSDRERTELCIEAA
mmetsp:Transcript_49492/g.146189  ORF Transcript_49492/g.146189 Transcript_49492/m.146189 type:complete len:156 (-) Transcript_49492:26-493(-)